MFTKRELDLVTEYGGYSDKEVSERDIPDVVASAQDCGVLDSRIGVWMLQGRMEEFTQEGVTLHVTDPETPSEVLVTLDLPGGVRLASQSLSAWEILGGGSLGESFDQIQFILASVQTNADLIERAYVCLSESP